MYRYRMLKDIREDRELGQKQIAALLGTTQKQYSRWETGTSEIPIHHLITLARYYRLSIDYLLEYQIPLE